MDCIDLFKRAAVALQTDSRYLVLDQTRKANDMDEELRDSGEGLCVFRCAREPDDESLRSLAKLLCARHSYCAVTFEIVQDDTLLGGFTAEIDGVTYDKSVRGQLRALAHDL